MSRRIGGRREARVWAGSNGPVTMAISGFSDSNYYASTATDEGPVKPSTVCVVFKLNALPSAGVRASYQCLDAATTGGWYFGTNFSSAGDISWRYNTSGGVKTSYGWVPVAADVGQVFAIYMTAEDGGYLQSYPFGQQMGTGIAIATRTGATSGSKEAVGRLLVATGYSDDALSIIAVLASNTLMSAAAIKTHYETMFSRRTNLVIPTLTGETHGYIASSAGATWANRSGATTPLTRNGSLTIATAPATLVQFSAKGQPWSDSGEPVDTSPANYDIPDEFATLQVTTNADTFQVQCYSNNAQGAAYDKVAVRVGGVAGSITEVKAPGATLSLGTPGTPKTVEVLTGPGVYAITPGVSNQGEFITRLAVPAGNTLSFGPTLVPTRGLVVVADSILSGYFPTNVVSQAPIVRVCATYPGRVSAFACGGYSLYWLKQKYGSVAALGAAIAAACTASGTREVLIQVVTNDFSNTTGWANVAAWQTDFASLLTAIRAGTDAYVWIATMGPRTDIVNNGHGETQAAWQTAQSAALAASGIANASVIAALYGAGDLYSDGLHLTTSGTANAAAAIKTEMGF